MPQKCWFTGINCGIQLGWCKWIFYVDHLFGCVDFVNSYIFSYSVLITCPGRDIGFSCWAVDASRCRKLPVNVEATFMGEAVLDFLFRSNVIYFHDMVNFVVVRSQLWTVMTCYILKNKWKPRKMPSVFYGALKNGHLLHLRYPHGNELHVLTYSYFCIIFCLFSHLYILISMTLTTKLQVWRTPHLHLCPCHFGLNRSQRVA